MSMASLPLFNFIELEEHAIDLMNEAITQYNTFYAILKDLASKGNQKAIDFRLELRGESNQESFLWILTYYSKKLKALSMTSEEEFTKVINNMKKLCVMARAYTRRFNDEFAIEGSNIEKIVVPTEEIAKSKSRGTTFYSPDGFDAYNNFCHRPIGKNLLPYNLSKNQEIEAIAMAKKSIKNSISCVEDGPEYAKYDMISYDVYSIVLRQEMIRRALNKDTYSPEEIVNLSTEYHYNEIMISVMH
jgi:hypothetical protein